MLQRQIGRPTEALSLQQGVVRTAERLATRKASAGLKQLDKTLKQLDALASV